MKQASEVIGKPMTTAEPRFEPLLTTEEAAKLLRIHPKTLQRLARIGEIAGIQIGKLWRFRVSALNDWVNRRARA